MEAYYSIDIDFWNRDNFNWRFFEWLAEAKVPMTIVQHHQELVPHIRQFDFDTLVNLDYHADVVHRCTRYLSRLRAGKCIAKHWPTANRLDCSNWVNFVNGDGRRFVWSYPEKVCYSPAVGRGAGTCHGVQVPANVSPFKVADVAVNVGWRNVCARHRWFPRLCDVVAIGIAISPHYAGADVTNMFLDVADQIPRLKAAASIAVRLWLPRNRWRERINYNDRG